MSWKKRDTLQTIREVKNASLIRAYPGVGAAIPEETKELT